MSDDDEFDVCVDGLERLCVDESVVCLMLLIIAYSKLDSVPPAEVSEPDSDSDSLAESVCDSESLFSSTSVFLTCFPFLYVALDGLDDLDDL